MLAPILLLSADHDSDGCVCVVLLSRCCRCCDPSHELHHDQEEEQQQRELTAVQTIAAVGSSPLVGAHLARVADAWTSGSRHCVAQLRKVGLNEEECAEVTETLLALQLQHSSN